MRVLMTGGGTAGHINPALTIAARIKKECPDAAILFVGAEGRMETQLVPAAGYPLKTVRVEGFQRKLSLENVEKNVKAAYDAVTAGITCRHIIDEFKPDIAIGTGGYVCGPILRQAEKRGIPVVLHESNAMPGVTVKMLAKKAAAVLVSDKSAVARLPEGTNVIVTGNPLRTDFLTMDRQKARQELGVDDRPLVLSFGGSLGARHLNEAMMEVLRRNAAQGKLQLIVGTGRGKNFLQCQSYLKEHALTPDGVHVRVREYIDDMPRCMAAADLVISRCGAMTLSELPAAGKPSVLVPSPYVAENHQFYNAQALASRGAAVCLEEKDLSGDTLWDTVCALALSPEKLRAMSDAAAHMAVTDASDRIWTVISDILAHPRQ